IYPDRRERAHALGIWTAVSGVSLALGPVLGGVLVAAGGWQNIFWFNLAFGLFTLAAAAWFVPESSDPEGRELDAPGLVAGAVALTAVTFAVIEGENGGYGRWWIALLFAIAALGAAAFVAIERRVRDPVLRLAFFRIPTFTGATVVGFGLGLALVAVSAAVLAVVPPERSGMAASTLNTSRELGGVLAVAILGAVVNGRLLTELTRKLNELGVPPAFHSLIINAVTHG